MTTIKPVRKAVIPAAGLGTRFLPATKATPKEMLPIVDKPTIQYIIEEALASGIEDIIIISGKGKRSIEDHFDRNMELEMSLEASGKFEQLEMVRRISEINLHYIRQKEPRGLGHAILCARRFIGDEPFAVLLGDDVVDSEKPALKQLIDVYDRRGFSVLGVQEVAPEKVSSYGIIDSVPTEEDRTYTVRLENTPPGRGNEIQLTDALRVLAKEQPMYAYNFEGRRYDVGDKQGFIEATVEFALKRPEMRSKLLEYLAHIVDANKE